jgi:hypothetical protein
MTLHLIKMAVGIADLDQLVALRRQRRAALDKMGAGDAPCRIRTRHMPKRAAELLDGGSLYWVIKGVVRARQTIVGVVAGTDADDKRCCFLELEHEVTTTEPQAHRAFQGWRYLAPAKAPPDRRGAGSGDALPAEMARELRALGLL